MDVKYDWGYKVDHAPLAGPCGIHDRSHNADRGGGGHWSACAEDMHGRLEMYESNVGSE